MSRSSSSNRFEDEQDLPVRLRNLSVSNAIEMISSLIVKIKLRDGRVNAL